MRPKPTVYHACIYCGSTFEAEDGIPEKDLGHNAELCRDELLRLADRLIDQLWRQTKVAIAWRERAARRLDPSTVLVDYIDVVFDGPPSHVSGRFVEVESPANRGVKLGEWVQDGEWWRLRFRPMDFKKS